VRWDIPPRHAVVDAKSPRWDRGRRICTFICLLILITATTSWFLVKEDRILVYAFVALLAWGLVCVLVIGTMMRRYHIDCEHIQERRAYHRLWEKEWQRWGEASLPVLDYSAILPREIPPVSLMTQPMLREEAVTPGSYPGATALLRALLLPMHSSLCVLLEHHSLAVSLPPAITERDFYRIFEEFHLPLTGITFMESDGSEHFSPLFNWNRDVENRLARLMIFSAWDEPCETTQGAVAWLLGPAVHQSPLPVRCALHRPKLAETHRPADELKQFLHYQPVAQQASDLWLNAGTLSLAAPFITQRTSCSALTPTSELTQHYLPHWLGKVSEECPFFAVTLMMQMAECRKGTQVLLHAGNNALIFCSVSAGVRADPR